MLFGADVRRAQSRDHVFQLAWLPHPLRRKGTSFKSRSYRRSVKMLRRADNR